MRGRPVDLLARQRELLKKLDLDKGEAGSSKADADEEHWQRDPFDPIAGRRWGSLLFN